MKWLQYDLLVFKNYVISIPLILNVQLSQIVPLIRRVIGHLMQTLSKIWGKIAQQKLFYLNLECKEWKSSCKSDGQKCIDSTQDCSQYSGDKDSCIKYLDSDNLNYYYGIAGFDQDIRPCPTLSCYLNTTESFQNGCQTKGVGCIVKTAKCDEYRGTRNQFSKISRICVENITEFSSGDATKMIRFIFILIKHSQLY
ncbi:unnamed protein product [Paramecium octaurelia]|uniref:Uncharacterized protein n=1 Tax=Paramecium octaurelia TaxID=43137 RepID=A0A8S1TFN1_PAROT|nr:unnamed protein product [Paramecium octaurelia]